MIFSCEILKIGDTPAGFHRLNVRMSLKIHFLHYHAQKFGDQSENESTEHRQRFLQVIRYFWSHLLELEVEHSNEEESVQPEIEK